MSEQVKNTELEKVELAAEPMSEQTAKLVKEVAAVFSSVKAEMKDEARKQREEAAQYALQNKAEEASKPDPTNIYAQDYAAIFKAALSEKTAEPKIEAKAGRAFAKSLIYLGQANGRAREALDLAKKEGVSGKELGIVAKALGVGDYSAGGALLDPEMIEEVIPELLSDTAIISDPDLPRFTLRGQAVIPYESAGPTARWHVEGAGANASESTFDQMVLTEKQCTVIVPVNKRFLRTVPNAEEFVLKSARRKVADAADSACLRSVGASGQVVGLRYKAAAANLLNVNATVSVANVLEDLGRLEQAVDDANVTWSRGEARIAFAPRTNRYLAQLQDNSSTGFVFRNEMYSMNTVNGIPVAGARKRGLSNIPTNLAVTDTSESEIYLYVASALRMGFGEDFRVEMGDGVAYLDSSGTATMGFSRDEVAFKVTLSFDFGEVYRGLATAVLIDVDWT